MMPVLVDTSVWVGHFRQANPALAALLVQDRVLGHPMVVCEIACGTPPERASTLAHLRALQPARQASTAEVLAFIEREQLFGLGCGWIDLLLLASSLINPGATLWTTDKRLRRLAQRFGVLYQPSVH